MEVMPKYVVTYSVGWDKGTNEIEIEAGNIVLAYSRGCPVGHEAIKIEKLPESKYSIWFTLGIVNASEVLLHRNIDLALVMRLLNESMLPERIPPEESIRTMELSGPTNTLRIFFTNTTPHLIIKRVQ